MMENELVLEKEAQLIRNSEIREGVQKILGAVPEYFSKIPASSTGKYHPKYALGEGGLVRHVKAAIKIALELFRMEEYDFDPIQRDVIIAALILHDCWKNGESNMGYTVHEHPLIAAEKIRASDMPFKTDIANAVASHMGQWTKNEHSAVVLPRPTTHAEKFVHLCDYLASRKILEVNFNV